MAISRRSLAAVAATVGFALLVVFSLPIAVEPGIKRRLMAAVGEEFDSQVDVEALNVSFFPRPRVAGQNLVLHHKRRTDVPPLITIKSFVGEASLLGLLSNPIQLRLVHLEGLEINVPPGGMGGFKGGDDKGGDKDDKGKDEKDKDDDGSPKRSPLVVASLISEKAVLRILRKTPGKTPRQFDIAHLAMQDVGAEHPWPFTAKLTNPTPPGEIETHGTFGPWNTEDPSRTPLGAEYRFDNADLGVFKGIQGILSSTGAFKGVLEHIEVDGQTTVPAFALAKVGNPVPLEARFHSIVDGTNGNTLLQPVDAKLGSTPIHASGGVVEREGEHGRTVTLDIVMNDARLEDVLRLAVKGSTPPMTGAMNVKAAFVLPPGDVDAMQKLRLDGTFAVATARFTKREVQAKIDEFSTKARGVRDETPDPVVSNFNGKFTMRDGVIQFADVTFSMPGTRVNVSGRFAMESQALDFRGTVRLDAKLSQLTSGMKSTLLGVIDGLFRHDDITVIPITIGGTAGQPKVGLDFGRVLKRN